MLPGCPSRASEQPADGSARIKMYSLPRGHRRLCRRGLRVRSIPTPRSRKAKNLWLWNAGDFPVDLGIPPLKIQNLLGSNPPKSRFLVCGWTAGRPDPAPGSAGGRARRLHRHMTVRLADPKPAIHVESFRLLRGMCSKE